MKNYEKYGNLHASVRSMREKVVVTECSIAGWIHYVPEDNSEDVFVGEKLFLVRDYDNTHDCNAVAVCLNDHDDLAGIIGYVPRTENKLIAQMIDKGWGDALKAELTTIKHDGVPSERLRMTIYLIDKSVVDNINVSEPHTFTVVLDNEEYDCFEDELYLKGFVFQRWGCYLSWDQSLPTKNDFVVFLHNCKKTIHMYLMKVIADGFDEASCLENAAAEFVTDCNPFILTNVTGPITVERNQLDFLEWEKIGIFQPNNFLPKDQESQILSIFKAYKQKRR